MFLKRLELYGFKTFSRKTQIEFPHGFLAVVGPNGSGKSNLTDAIRFCLGESNVKALRATRLDELVFAGTPTRNPAPYAEVTAVFDNSDSKLPIELSEVSITRRLDPDGGSKFQINGTTCRLKDVHELLMGSGIGPGSFSVLGGKEVDRVLSSDPKDRRLMLEETAGVNRYRFRKKEAQRRLGQTENNLTRLRDILKEVEDQLAESKRQLQRYERYKKSQDELKSLDRQVAFHELAVLGEQKKELEAKTQQAQDELEAARDKEKSSRIGLEELRQQKAQIDLERERSSSEIATLREQTGAARAAHEGTFRRARELELSARTALERLESSDQRIDQQSRRLQELEERNPELESQFKQAQAEVDRLQASLAELPAPGQGPNAELRVKLSELEKQKDRLLNQLSSLEARMETDRLRGGEVQEQLQELETEIAGLATAEFETEGLAAELQEREAEVGEARTKLKQRQETLGQLKNKRSEHERNRRPLISKVAELEALLEDRSGLPPAVRAVMSWKESGVVGLLGELIKVPEGLEQAFEAALGGHINDVVTENRRVASSLIERLKRERVGRVTFWPLDLDRRPPRTPELPDRRGVVGRALELLGYPPKIEAVLQEVLGRTVIMEDLPVALALYDRCGRGRPHLVTREGEYLNPSGALTGGARRHSKAGLLSRRRKLDEARSQLLDLENDLIALSEEEERLQGHIAAAEAELSDAREAAHQARQQLQEVEAQQRRQAHERKKLDERRQKLENERERMQSRSAELAQELQQKTEAKEENERETARLQEEFARNQEEENRLGRLREELQKEQLGAKLQLERVQNLRTDLEREKSRERQRKEELVNDRSAAQREHQRCLEARERLEEEGKELTTRLETLQKELEEKTKALEELRSKNSTLEQQTRQASQIFESSAARCQQWMGKVNNLQVELARVHTHYEQAEARLAEGGEEGEELKALTAQELEQARKRIERLKNFLDNFGGVNLGAREDYERLSERHQQLDEQIHDLTEGARSLRKIMAELDKATVTRFEATFHSVNNTFSRLFTDLFGGGQAKLELCEPDNILESGVEIMACPPGKKVQNMTLLSSGERALSAIAFLMSLLAHKPSPIVILDELDAPLDERNVEKVATRLVEFSTSSQFLVITHNRKTMEFADRLYGVTMVEPGTSKVVTVQLATVEQELGAPLG